MPKREPKKKIARKAAKKTARKPLPGTPKDLAGHVLALGGESVDVDWLDERDSEEVLVCLVKLEAYPMFMTLVQMNEDYRLVELSCDKSTGWAADMHPLSVQRLKRKAVELNFTSVRE